MAEIITATGIALTAVIGAAVMAFRRYNQQQEKDRESLRQERALMRAEWREDREQWTREQAAMREDLSKIAVNVEKVEIATNSMKDALVDAAKEAGLEQGRKQGVKEERARTSEEE